MNKLKCITYADYLQNKEAEDSSSYLDELQGVPYIYFSCHPSDFGLFEDIKKDIFGICRKKYEERENEYDCVIWYNATPEEPWDEEEMKEVLSRMNVIVVPITYSFLYDTNYARENEFQYACDEHIFVLPILMDSNLEEDFDEICGNLHAIYKTGYDPEGRTYEEQLESFFSPILADNDLNLLKKEFSAHIFLSYRKKDKEYAKKLINLIYKNDFCRDVSIWYDEYLVPGECFTTALEKEINDSDMVILLVTPRVLEDDNYVKANEYPYAKDHNKYILPVEMDKLSNGEQEDFYNNSFKGVTETIDPSDGTLLSDSLFNQLHDIINVNNDDSEHLYLIGRAYKDGLYVERNHERAVDLIKIAAKDYPPAMEELAHMYLYGDGVVQDVFESLDWIQKEITFLKNQYRKENSIKNGKTAHIVFVGYINILTYFLSLISANKGSEEMINENIEICCEDISLLKSMQERYNCDFVSTDLCSGYIRLCQAYLFGNNKEKKLAEADNAFQQAQNIYNDLIKLNSEDKETMESLGINLYSVCCNLCFCEGKVTEAKRSVQRVVDIINSSKAPDRAPQLYQFYGIVITSLKSLATLYRGEGNYIDAKKIYEEALEYEKEQAKWDNKSMTTQIISTRNNICACEIEIAQSGKNPEGLEKLKNYAEDCYNECKKLPEDLTSMEARVKSAVQLGNVYRMNGDVKSAKNYFNEAKNKCHKLCYEMGNDSMRNYFALIYDNLGLIFSEENDFTDAEENYIKGKKIRKNLLDEEKSDETRIEYADSCEHLGELYLGKGKNKDAKDELQLCINSLEEINENTITMATLFKLINAYIEIARVCDNLEELAEEEKYLKIVSLLIEKNNDKDQTEDLLLYIANADLELAQIYQKKRDVDETDKYFTDGIKNLDRLYKMTKEERYLDMKAAINYQFGLYTGVPDSDKLKTAEKIWQILNDRHPGEYEKKLNDVQTRLIPSNFR